MAEFRETLATYFERRMARILLLGIVSGFPWVLIGSSLNLWLKEDGLSRSAIGWAGLIFGVYAFNFLWAPLIDRIRLPWISARLGHRRSWIVTLQAVILACLVLWSTVEPAVDLGLVVAIGLAIAVASATQDIVIDALRIEQVGEAESGAMAAGAAVAVVGWWTGYKLGGIVALGAAQYFEQAGVEHYWQATFLVLGIPVVLCNIGLAFVPEASAAGAHRRAGPGRADARLPARRPRPGGPNLRLARRNPGRSADELLPAQRLRHRRRRAGLHLPLQDRRGVHGPHVARLLQGGGFLQVGHRPLFQGPRLAHHCGLHRARRAVRHPHRARAGDVRLRDRPWRSPTSCLR